MRRRAESQGAFQHVGFCCIGVKLLPQFFVHFLQWAGLFCMWVLATLVAGVVQDGRDNDLDGQYIAIVAL